MMNKTPAINAQIPATMLPIEPRPTPRRLSPVIIKKIPSKIHFNLLFISILLLYVVIYRWKNVERTALKQGRF
jgi:hypothetical protein